MTNQVISVDAVEFSYGKGPNRTVALEGIDLAIEGNEFMAILGPSGCGKSTLLYLIGGFLAPSSGNIKVNGKDVRAPGPDRGVVFQHFALFPWLTVKSNIMYGLRKLNMSRDQREDNAPSTCAWCSSPDSRTTIRASCPAA